MGVELEQAWETHISADFFARAKAEFEKNNPAAIGLFEVMIAHKCIRVEKSLDVIEMSKRIVEFKCFDIHQTPLFQIRTGNPLAPQIQEELEASEYMATCGYVPAMCACGSYYERLAKATSDFSHIDNAVKRFSRGAECGNWQAISRLRTIKREYKGLPGVKSLPSAAKLRDRERKILDFEEEAAELMARIPATAAIMGDV